MDCSTPGSPVIHYLPEFAQIHGLSINEYYSTIKRNKVLIHATTWINLENILNGRSQSQKTVHHMIPFTWNFHNREIYRDWKQFSDWGDPGGTSDKELPANAGDVRDVGSIPGSGRSPGEGNGNSFQYFCLENPMDRGTWLAIVHGVTKSWAGLKQLNTQN